MTTSDNIHLGRRSERNCYGNIGSGRFSANRWSSGQAGNKSKPEKWAFCWEKGRIFRMIRKRGEWIDKHLFWSSNRKETKIWWRLLLQLFNLLGHLLGNFTIWHFYTSGKVSRSRTRLFSFKNISTVLVYCGYSFVTWTKKIQTNWTEK